MNASLRPALLLLALAAWPTVAAASNWTVTTSDFQTQTVDFRGLAGDGVRVAAAGKPDWVVPLDTFISAQRSGKPEVPAPPKFALAVTGGDRLVGEPAGVEGENLTWSEPLLGPVAVPLNRLTSMTRGSATTGSDDRPRQDVVTLANGDTVTGIVTGVADGRLTVQPAEGGATAVPLTGVTHVAFASAGGQPASAEQAFRVRLTDGSALTVARASVTGETLSLTLPGRAGRVVPLPLAAVTGIEQVNGPVGWLSSRVPTESVQVPYLGGATPWPARFDAAVDGGPLAFNGLVFDRGIGVHAYSRLTFPVDPGWAAFRTQYAVDSRRDAPRLLADVTVRIRVDDKVVHEQQHLRAGVLSPVVRVDLAGAKTLTLECDYGPAGDTQAHLDWLQPALLRTPPTSRP